MEIRKTQGQLKQEEAANQQKIEAEMGAIERSCHNFAFDLKQKPTGVNTPNVIAKLKEIAQLLKEDRERAAKN